MIKRLAWLKILKSAPGAAIKREANFGIATLARTSDPVRLSVLRSVLTDAEIDHYVFDAGVGSLWQGAIPMRLMVREEDVELARRAITEAGL